MKTRILKKIRFSLEQIFKPMIEALVAETLDRTLELRMQQKTFEHAMETEKASYWEQMFDAPALAERFRSVGMPVEEVAIDRADFEQWMQEYSDLVHFYRSMDDVMIEKLLEHYLTFTHLHISPSDVVIDIAAANSPFSDALSQKGINAYRQDLVYAQGIHGVEIGSDAGNMPLPDGFADALTLHCAFECFQGDSDICFVREACRVLASGGRIGIIPLYADTIYFVKTSPGCDQRTIKIEPEARRLWRDDRYLAPFSRHYSPEIFVKRITTQMSSLKPTIIFFTNLDELSQAYSGQRIYCYFMFKGEKP